MGGYTQPRSESAALLTIDVQNDFTRPDAPATVEGTAEVVPQLQRLVAAFRAAGAPIVHVVRLYEPDGSNVDICRKAHVEDGAEIVRPDTDGAELVEALKPSQDVRLESQLLLDGEFQAIGTREWAMYKPRWSAFFRTALDDFLTTRSVDTLVVCGCNFPNCPRTTIYEASERDYRLVFVPDATSGVYERGLEELANVGVRNWDTAVTVEWIAE